jgi:hypothetical protein
LLLYGISHLPMRATCFAHLVFLDWIVLMMFGED